MPDTSDTPSPDVRLYLPDIDGWSARVQKSGERLYCFYKLPGQDYFHLLMDGEIFLQKGEEVVCLMCALRRGVVTTDRLNWQHRA
ncbi:MAG: hypothetical protein JNG89_00845, partial [Planctomycetaceae bacterium]|nr:hypothetical protein [Planctomycetaceae bacterium]